jgi:hypothetical protein
MGTQTRSGNLGPPVVDGGALADQAPQLRQLGAGHAETGILLRALGGPWQAIVAEPGGQTIIFRWKQPAAGSLLTRSGT